MKKFQFSKIKEIMVELHNYQYIHNSSSMNQIDDRFIGRTELRKKMEVILTNDSTNSGAYLITGYRGMGKTSFVNQAINDINPSIGFRVFFKKTYTIFLLSMLFFLGQNYWINNIDGWYTLWTLIPNFLIWLILNIYLTSGSSLYFNLRTDENRWSIYHRPSYYFNVLVYNRRMDKSSNRMFNSVQILTTSFIVYLYSFIVYSIIGMFKEISFPGAIIINLLLSVVGSSWHNQNLRLYWKGFIKKNIESVESGYTLDNPTFWKKVKRIRNHVKGFLKYWSNKYNYSKRVYININFSYENLSETDIFKSIVTKLKRKFSEMYRLRRLNIYTIPISLLVAYKIHDNHYYNLMLETIAANLSKYILFKPSYVFVELFNKLEFFLTQFFFSYNVFYGLVKFFGAYLFIYLIVRPVLYYLFVLLTMAINPYCNPYTVSRKIEFLSNLIEAQLSQANGADINIAKRFFSFSLSRKQVKNYTKADNREIESYLLEILEDIDNIKMRFKASFSFIFDELDKVEHNSNAAIEDKDSEEGYKDNFQKSKEGIRKRQNTILQIIANLKHFLTSAKAKFIFIAGHEMYDAALADVANRNLNLGSIFHNRHLYVPSFLSDPSFRVYDKVNSMVEWFLCKYLIPDDYYIKALKKNPNTYYSLYTFNDYLKTLFPEDLFQVNPELKNELRDRFGISKKKWKFLERYLKSQNKKMLKEDIKEVKKELSYIYRISMKVWNS